MADILSSVFIDTTAEQCHENMHEVVDSCCATTETADNCCAEHGVQTIVLKIKDKFSTSGYRLIPEAATLVAFLGKSHIVLIQDQSNTKLATYKKNYAPPISIGKANTGRHINICFHSLKLYC